MKFQTLLFALLIALALSACTSPAWNQYNNANSGGGICSNCAADAPTLAGGNSGTPANSNGCGACTWDATSTTATQVTCTTCLPGYYLTGTTCTLCSSSGTCRACTSSTVCTDCVDGNYLVNNACVPCDNTNCPSNDKCCSGPSDYCSSCWSNFSLLSIFALISIIALLI